MVRRPTLIDGGISPSPIEDEGNPVEIAVANPDALELEEGEATATETDDGGVVLDFAPQEDAAEEAPHNANLADFVEDGELVKLGSELVQAYKDDERSRDPWEKAYSKGIQLLGLKIEERTQPWTGASGVFHPILTEAVIRFQADAMMETFPASGPVLTRIVGTETPDKVKQARRVKNDMNYQITENMPEYRQEHERLLFNLPLAGSAFKKVYFDYQLGRPTAVFVPAEDFVIAYGASDLQACPRYTHVLRLYKNDLLKAQKSGQYLDIDVPEPVVTYSDMEKKKQETEGYNPTVSKDDRYTLLEMHVDFDLPGFEDKDDDGEDSEIGLPYIITIDRDSNKVLSIYRNWEEDDELQRKQYYFIHYQYLPGLGFYGIGLVHMLGGIAKATTSILRQLIDAGTLANLQAGFKAKGLRIKGDDSPLRPGEWRDVDVPGSSIRDSLMVLPYKEPSPTLFQLMGALIEEGRTIASIGDLKISDMNQQAPVGTTLAIIERGMKVISAVHARIHYAMRMEFKLLSGLIRDYMDTDYEYEAEENVTREKDYDDRVDILPVSNPNASTMAQRIMQYQAALQLAQSAPEIYDRRELHRQMVTVLGLENPEKIVPMDSEKKPMDPVAENMAIIQGKPTKAFLYQDHEAHITAHMAAAKDPKLIEIISKSPVAKVIEATMTAHLQEHLAYQYRVEIEKQLGVQLPPEDQELPPEVEADLSRAVAAAADKLLAKDQAEAKAKRIAEQQEDPVIQIQKQDAQTKADEVKRKAQADQLRAQTEEKKLASGEKIAGAELGVEIMKAHQDDAMEGKELSSKEKAEDVKAAVGVVQALLNLVGRRTESKPNENKSEKKT